MDGAGETSLAAAAMKTVRSSLRRITSPPSSETLAARFGRGADPAATRDQRRYLTTQRKDGRRLKTVEEEGLLLIVPSLSHRPLLHRLFPPPPLLFLLHSILSRLPLFLLQRNAVHATILEQRWHKMEVGRPVTADKRWWPGSYRRERRHNGETAGLLFHGLLPFSSCK